MPIRGLDCLGALYQARDTWRSRFYFLTQSSSRRVPLRYHVPVARQRESLASRQ